MKTGLQAFCQVGCPIYKRCFFGVGGGEKCLTNIKAKYLKVKGNVCLLLAISAALRWGFMM